jgi:hypothetical protein
MLGTVSDLDVALITGGFTVAAVMVTFGGNYLLDQARDRRAARQARASAIADLLTTSVELVLAVNAIRAAYQYRTSNRARLMIGAALLRDLPNLDSWKDLTDRDVQRTMLRTVMGLSRDRDDEARATVVDYTGMVIPQTSRFFAAVTAVTLGEDKKTADAARQLGTAGAVLLEASGASRRQHAKARGRFERELGKFRTTVDRR